MKNTLIALTLIFSSLPANAQQKTYTYTEMCWYLGKQNHPYVDKANCKITDVRNSQGFLQGRMIEAKVINSNISYTVKSWFGSKGFMTWDSDSRRSYRNQYSIANPTAGVIKDAKLPAGSGVTQVTKDLWVRQISWD